MNLFSTLAAYDAADMTVHYWLDDDGIPGMSITPTRLNDRIATRRTLINDEQGMRPLHDVFHVDFPACTQSNLVQLKVAGDVHAGGFSGGTTMTNSASARNLRFTGQRTEPTPDGFMVVTELADARGLCAEHRLRCWKDQPFMEVCTVVENGTGEPLRLEMLASFSLGGLSPFQPDHGPGKYHVHRFMSSWSAEGRHECRPIEQLNLEKSWSGHGVRSLRFGQAGSMPVKGWFPFAALEDREYGVLWGAQIAHPGSWQMEVYRQSDLINLCGGLADRETGHWMKSLAPGERFETPKAILSCCTGDIQDLVHRMVRYQQLGDDALPPSEQELPVIFNDWCTTWGHPSEENILKLARRIEGLGIGYLVMDDGWFNDKPGCQQGLGDWNVSKTIYPGGFKHLHDTLRAMGLVSGVWFELENCTRGSALYEMTGHLLHRDGQVLQAGERRFLDFRDPWVHEYLADKVIRMLKENGITYIKTDYNDTIGLGCDGAESLGEGLRQHLEQVQRFYRRMLDEIPGLKIELCASGGHRLEPSWMALGSMGGFSDSHEGLDIPIIAANTQMMIPARKNQCWAVLRKEDPIDRLYYSLAGTFMGRMCLSGDIHELNAGQMQAVQDGIDMYHTVKASIKNGTSRKFGSTLLSYTSPEGWQAVVRTHDNLEEAFVVVHTFANAPDALSVPLSGTWAISGTYKQADVQVGIQQGSLAIGGLHDFQGLVIRLMKA